jgi:hypothetical protein
MVPRDEKIQKLERALSEAYRSQPDRHVGDMTQPVMRAVRQSAGERERWIPTVVDQLVWRTATIAAAVVLTVTVFTVGTFQTTRGENNGLLAEEFESAPLFAE